MRSAKSPPARDRSSRILPNAAWVDCSSPDGGTMAGTSATFHGRSRLALALRLPSTSDFAASALLPPQRGRAHVRTPVTNAQLVTRLLLENKKQTSIT